MLLNPGTYAEVPKQPGNPLLARANPVNSSAIIDQPAQLEAPEVWVYGKQSQVWPYGLFKSGKMISQVRVYCIYNYPPRGILQITIK